MLDNMGPLYPIAGTVFQTVYSVFDDLDVSIKGLVCQKIRELYESGHEVMGIENHLAFAIESYSEIQQHTELGISASMF